MYPLLRESLAESLATSGQVPLQFDRYHPGGPCARMSPSGQESPSVRTYFAEITSFLLVLAFLLAFTVRTEDFSIQAKNP